MLTSNSNHHGYTWDKKALFMAYFFAIQERERCPLKSFAFSINKKPVFVGLVEQEQWLNVAQRVRLCPSKQTLWANQLISPTLEEEWGHYQALADVPPLAWSGIVKQ